LTHTYEAKEHRIAIEKEVLDQLLTGRNPKDVFGKDDLAEELRCRSGF
jgi:hypothetical protein